MVTPGIKLEDVFKRVRVDVQQESNSQQVPWDASSVTGDFYFVTSIAAAPDQNQIELADLQKRASVEQSKRLEQERARAEQQAARLEQERIKKVGCHFVPSRLSKTITHLDDFRATAGYLVLSLNSTCMLWHH